NPDARAMNAAVAAALVVWDVDGVVLDLRNLSYVWGDGLLQVFRPTAPGGYRALAWAVVASERCRAVRTLIGDALVFDDLDAAIAHAARIARERARLDERLESAPLVIAVSNDLWGPEQTERAATVAARAALAADDCD